MDEDDPKRAELEKREAGLWKKGGASWKKGLPPNVRCNRFKRGFPVNRNVGISTRAFLKLRRADLAPIPLWDYYLMKAGAVWKQLLASPNLLRLGWFNTSITNCGPEGARQLADCRYLRNVAVLSLGCWRIGVAGLDFILNSATIPSLRELDLSDNGLGNEGACRVASSPLLGQLQSLSLEGNGIDHDGYMALVRSAGTTRLTRLRLANNPLGDRAVGALTRWAGVSALRTLILYQAELSDAAAIELAECPTLAQLEELYLGWNRIGATGALALANSPHLTSLTDLYLNDNPLRESRRAVSALRSRFGNAVHF
jgi:hypothetical protein